jgi:hypothetical protein
MVPTWRTAERQSPSGAIESEQRLVSARPVVPVTEAGALTLGRLYWEALESFVGRVVRVRRLGDGGVELRLPAGPVLLRFGAPELALSDGGVSCRYPIHGGLLARRRSGAITFEQRVGAGGVVLRSAISGFHPTLAARPGRPEWTGALYVQGQSRLHVALSRRYFARLLAGSP